jgi:hypothetical protein
VHNSECVGVGVSPPAPGLMYSAVSECGRDSPFDLKEAVDWPAHLFLNCRKFSPAFPLHLISRCSPGFALILPSTSRNRGHGIRS